MDIAHVTSLGSTAGTLMGSNIILDTHIPSKSLFSITLVLICITLCLASHVVRTMSLLNLFTPCKV